jgi:hypothetical protein
LTPSDLASLNGCFRYFQWTRLLSLSEPGREAAGDTPQMHLGSLAHEMIEAAVAPSAEALRSAGLPDLGPVFESPEWRELAASSPEREMPFLMCLNAGGRECCRYPALA